MSKIKIPLNNIRYKLHDLFHEYLEELHSYNVTHRRGGSYNWEDDDEVQYLMQQGVIFPGLEDDYETVWPPTSESHSKRKKLDPYGEYWDMIDAFERKKKKHKRGNRGKGKARVIDINVPYSGDEENPDEYGVDEYDSDGIEDGKVIWFYPDYAEKGDRLEFNTLSAFSDFCAEEGYVVSADVGMEIAFRRVSHCCLDPILREDGIFQVIAAESYGDMRYDAMPVTELSQ